MLAATLTSVNVIGASVGAGVEITTGAGLVDCLLRFLKGSNPSSLFTASR